MITPPQIRQKAQKLWDSGHILHATLRQESLFPWSIAFRKPSTKQQLENFDTVRQWLSTLKSQAKSSANKTKQGGYTIEYKTTHHRQLGTQQLPTKIVFQHQQDLLLFLGVSRQFNRLLQIAEETSSQFPVLKQWLINKPRLFMKYLSIWAQLLSICDYLIKNPQPNCYLRELEINGIDSKFIEKNTKILADLLDLVLPSTAINHAIISLRQHGFERRYGFKFDQPLVRLRLLDRSLYPRQHLNDISLPFSQLACWKIACKRVFITENKISGLSFPDMPEAIVIFGLGYGIDQLAEVTWLADCELVYWGDIDTHGFSILSRLRHHFPHVHSLMMDASTLQQHSERCGLEPKNARYSAQLSHLIPQEQQLYQQLQQSHQRLEQERLPMAYIKYCLDNNL
jgi:hypothetical protein